MPLAPKQQPPYYVPQPMPTPGGTAKFSRLNAQFTPEQTSGTTETDMYLYTIPANTLTQNGDGIYIDYNVINSTSAEDHITRFYLDGTNQATVNDQTNGYLKFTIQMVRISTTQMYIISQSWSATTIGIPDNQIANTLDFTQDIPIKFTGQCTGTAVIETELMTIDKQLL